MKTFSAKAETVKRDWYVVDATDKTLGRLSTEIARRLRGKHIHLMLILVIILSLLMLKKYVSQVAKQQIKFIITILDTQEA